MKYNGLLNFFLCYFKKFFFLYKSNYDAINYLLLCKLFIIKNVLISERFGSQKIDDEVIERFEKVTGKKGK